MPLLREPLSPQERAVVAMRREGRSNTEIGEALQIPNKQVSTVVIHARKKGAVVPYSSAPREPMRIYPRTNKQVVPIERLVHLRKLLLAAGNSRYGVNGLIAKRVGMTRNAVKIRLWKHDHKQGASQ